MKKWYVIHAAYCQKYEPEVKFHHLAEVDNERDACTLLVSVGISADYKPFAQYPADYWFTKTETFIGRYVKGKPGFRYRLSIEQR